MTILERLSVLSDLLTVDVDNLRYVDISMQFFMSSLPINLSAEYFVEYEVPVEGIKARYKHYSVIRGDRVCRKVNSNLFRLLQNNDSEFYPSEYDPCYIVRNGIIYVFPTPTVPTNSFVLMPPMNYISNYSDASISEVDNFPDDAINVVLYHTAYLILNKKLRLERASFPQLPTMTPVDLNLNLNFPSINENDYGDVDLNVALNELNNLNLPSISDGDYTLTTQQMQAGMSALENASKFIGEIQTDANVPRGAFWLDDEDPEMVGSSVSLAAQEVNRANSYFQNRTQGLQSYNALVNAKVSEYRAKVEVILGKINAQISTISAELQANRLKLEAVGMKYQEVNARLQEFQTKVQATFQENTEKLQLFAHEVNKYTTMYQSYSQESANMYQLYQLEMEKFVMSNGPNPNL